MTDETIGRNIKRLRGRRSLDSVAISLNLLLETEPRESRTVKWRRQTLIRLERGERSLKLAEAVPLAKILGCTLADLVEGV